REDVERPDHLGRLRSQLPLRLEDEPAVAQHGVELAVDAILLVGLLPRAVERDAENGEARAHELLGLLGIEGHAEVRADQARDTARGGLRDHRVDVPAEERLAPVAELDPPQVGRELIEHLGVELRRDVPASAPLLAVAREAGGAAEGADVPPLDHQLDRISAQARAQLAVLPPVQREVEHAPRRHARALVARMLEEAADRSRDGAEAVQSHRLHLYAPAARAVKPRTTGRGPGRPRA